MYARQEADKTFVKYTGWRCPYCSKIFVSELYLDKHLDTKHPEEAPTYGRCLADLCPVFGCDAPTCAAATLTAHRRRCRDVMAQCYPQQASPRLHDALARRYCNAFTCDGGGRLRLPAPADITLAATVRHWGHYWGSVRGVITAVAVLVLAAFYVVLWLIRRENTMHDDLWQFRRRRRRRQSKVE
eukprot:TRINITY_DN5939_c0_g1_i1.p1 TRINITY_DN5939_c0_g1~~TRINITY_DN5939_c0_g1_i1.p1  ORF type:complete len:185 (-),score=26.44 TRINITY_DN5939_c0_g1_i1:78-632(-)